jgi:hypothetical protein
MYAVVRVTSADGMGVYSLSYDRYVYRGRRYRLYMPRSINPRRLNSRLPRCECGGLQERIDAVWIACANECGWAEVLEVEDEATWRRG